MRPNIEGAFFLYRRSGLRFFPFRFFFKLLLYTIYEYIYLCLYKNGKVSTRSLRSLAETSYVYYLFSIFFLLLLLLFNLILFQIICYAFVFILPIHYRDYLVEYIFFYYYYVFFFLSYNKHELHKYYLCIIIKKHNSLYFESVYTTCHDAEIAQRRFRYLGFHCSAL